MGCWTRATPAMMCSLTALIESSCAVASTIFGFPIIMVLNGLSVGSIEFCVQSDAASEGPPSYFSNRGPRALDQAAMPLFGNQKPRQEGRGLAV